MTYNARKKFLQLVNPKAMAHPLLAAPDANQTKLAKDAEIRRRDEIPHIEQRKEILRWVGPCMIFNVGLYVAPAVYMPGIFSPEIAAVCAMVTTAVFARAGRLF